MILLDTNVLIDLFGSTATVEAEWSRRSYARLIGHNTMFCNHIVLAELVGQADLPELVSEKIDALQVDVFDLTNAAAFAAGHAFAAYRARGGRKTMLPDFLIGGHAVASAAQLMTRDRRLATYFPDLTLITPETHP